MMNGWRRMAVAAIVSLVFLPGCLVRSLIEGDKSQKGLLSPDIIKVTVPTDPPKPAVKETLPPAPEPEPAPAPAPPVDQKLLPQQIDDRKPDIQVVSMSFRNAAFTPKASRFQTPPDVTLQDLVITEDALLKGDILVVGAVSVASQATVTIAPGARVRFRPSEAGEAALVVQGRLLVQGTADQPVLFVGDGHDTTSGDWQGIILLGSSKKNIIQHAVIEGAETGIDALYSNLILTGVRFSGCLQGLAIVETVASMNGGEIAGCRKGIQVTDGEIEISGTRVTGNGVGMDGEKAAVFVSSGYFAGNRDAAVTLRSSRINISGTIFNANGSGVVLAESEGEVTGNTFQEHRGAVLRLSRSKIRVTGNDISRNDAEGIVTDDGRSTFWGNILAGNRGYDIYNAGSDDVRAFGNWWEGPPQEKIFDRKNDAGKGKVLFSPVLKKKPGLSMSANGIR